MNAKEMAKLVVNVGWHEAKKKLMAALKEEFGVSGMHFWKDSSGWKYCSEKHPKDAYPFWSHGNYDDLELDELASLLSSLHNKKWGVIIFENEQHRDLDAIRKQVLIRKLAGVK